MERRVVITGIGAVTPLGHTLQETWQALLSCKSGITLIHSFDTTNYACKIAGQVFGFDPKKYFSNPKDIKRTDRYAHFAIAAAKMAIEDSGLDKNQLNLERCACIIGSGIGGLYTLEQEHQVLLQKGPSRISPFVIPMLISNMASGLVAMEHGFLGANFAVVTACATSAQSLGEAWRLIKFNEADVILAGGSESAITPLGVAGFSAMKALSTRNDAPEKASRPFDRERDGFVMSEGAGVLVVEEYQHAKKRGARIYGEIIGYGLSCDAYHMTSPSPQGEGSARAMKNALSQARLNPSQIDYINAHATSTPIGDVCETQAIKSVFGPDARKVSISSTKSMLGHLLGAAGAVEMAICLKAMEENVIPPTINLENPDPECDLDYTPNQPREKEIQTVMNNSFGFGGHNCSLIATKI